MPRNMSFALTTAQFKARTKTVTRRMGWRSLRLGEQVCGVEKAQGLKRGEKIKRLGLIEIEDIRFERLNEICADIEYGTAEMVREGFPDMDPIEFLLFFCDANGCRPDATITRIQFRYT